MAYNTPEMVADYLARFQMEITHRGKGTFTPDHVKYSLTIASGGKDFFTTFESNPHVHGEPTITQVFGALASDAMVVRDYGMDEFVDEFCDGMKQRTPSPVPFMPRSRRNMAKTSPIVPTTSYRTTMISRGA